MDRLLLFIVVWALLNVIAFALYGIDKRKAIKDKWRIKESTLLIAAFFGAIGATIGMNLFRHKTRKPVFKLVYVFLALDIVLIILYFAYTNNLL